MGGGNVEIMVVGGGGGVSYDEIEETAEIGGVPEVGEGG